MAAIPHTHPVRDALSSITKAFVGSGTPPYTFMPLAAGVKFTSADLLFGTIDVWTVADASRGVYKISHLRERPPGVPEVEEVAWSPQEITAPIAQALTAAWDRNRTKIDLFDWRVGQKADGYIVTQYDDEGVEFTTAAGGEWFWEFASGSISPLVPDEETQADPSGEDHPLNLFVRPPCPV
jgi:hypothetical protein